MQLGRAAGAAGPSAAAASAPGPGPGMGELPAGAASARLYGAAIDEELAARAASARSRMKRKRVNCVAMLAAFLLPWGLFVAVFGAVSFYPHYAAPNSTNLAAFAVLALSVSKAVSGYRAWLSGEEDRAIRLYIGLALAAAAGLAWFLGDVNFWSVMQPSYHVEHLAAYSGVDPSSRAVGPGERAPARGRRYQDAGKVYFTPAARLDITKAMSFKSGRLYCVAPIVNPHCQSNCGYDFWAVGTDCCSELAADFRCGAYNSTAARSGLRMVVDTQLPFYRLAVMQAEGIHHVTSQHPLFFHWVENPVAQLSSWKMDGYRQFIALMLGVFVANAAALASMLKRASA